MPRRRSASPEARVDVMAEDADRALPRVVEMADQREQRCLAGAVEAEQHGEGAGCDREGDVVQRLLGP